MRRDGQGMANVHYHHCLIPTAGWKAHHLFAIQIKTLYSHVFCTPGAPVIEATYTSSQTKLEEESLRIVWNAFSL